MKKIIIIDDRQKRQEVDLGKNTENDLYKEIIGLKSTVTLSKQIKCLNELDEYDIIAIHRTYVVENFKLEDLISYVTNLGKYLILFSGGINDKRVDLNGRYLSLNSKSFYNSHLVEFLKDLRTTDDINLYKLLYGKSWKLPILLRYRQLKWQKATSDADVLWMEDIEDEFEETRDIDQSIENLLRGI